MSDAAETRDAEIATTDALAQQVRTDAARARALAAEQRLRAARLRASAGEQRAATLAERRRLADLTHRHWRGRYYAALARVLTQLPAADPAQAQDDATLLTSRNMI